MLVVLAGCGGRTDSPPLAADGVDAAAGVDADRDADSVSVDLDAEASAPFDLDSEDPWEAACSGGPIVSCVVNPRAQCQCGDSCADQGSYLASLPPCR